VISANTRGTPRQARRYGAVDHGFRGIGEQQIRAQPAEHAGELDHAARIDQRIEPGALQRHRLVGGAALGERAGDRANVARRAAGHGMAGAHHVRDQLATEVDQRRRITAENDDSHPVTIRAVAHLRRTPRALDLSGGPDVRRSRLTRV
jgi:hypothetical protein